MPGRRGGGGGRVLVCGQELREDLVVIRLLPQSRVLPREVRQRQVRRSVRSVEVVEDHGQPLIMGKADVVDHGKVEGPQPELGGPGIDALLLGGSHGHAELDLFGLGVRAQHLDLEIAPDPVGGEIPGDESLIRAAAGGRKRQRLPVDGRVEGGSAFFDHQHLLLDHFFRHTLEPRCVLDPLGALIDLPRDVQEERFEIERFVEVVDQELQVQELLFERRSAGAKEGVDDRREHVLAQRALGLLALAGQFGVEARVGLARLHPLAQDRVASLPLPQITGRPETQDRDRDRGQEPAHGLEDDRDLVPPVAFGHSRSGVGSPAVGGHFRESDALPPSLFTRRSYRLGFS